VAATYAVGRSRASADGVTNSPPGARADPGVSPVAGPAGLRRRTAGVRPTPVHPTVQL